MWSSINWINVPYNDAGNQQQKEGKVDLKHLPFLSHKKHLDSPKQGSQVVSIIFIKAHYLK